MRMIDADEFKKQIAAMAITNNYPADKANKMCELIDCQPTAYDVEKVAEQLCNEAKRWEESGIEYEDKGELGIAQGIRIAEKIIRIGGTE